MDFCFHHVYHTISEAFNVIDMRHDGTSKRSLTTTVDVDKNAKNDLRMFTLLNR